MSKPKRKRSKTRGGASASPDCKSGLAACMKANVCTKGMKGAGRVCIDEFNFCRGVKSSFAKKARAKARRRKAK